ncbi:hypothetical protein BB558_004022 [Smittium angustum]|uniref:37S ribosomal protein S35, mitochondrial n=1 Tax=Smittium angustum TaxID=133377 RepID=A0A2U1J4G3_SMIAN|nr:hypothetical protein BB558_004022 [Smittium angustum]
MNIKLYTRGYRLIPSTKETRIFGRYIHNSKILKTDELKNTTENEPTKKAEESEIKVEESEIEEPKKIEIPEFMKNSEEGFGEDLDPNTIALKQAEFWIEREGVKFKNPVKGSTNYVGGKIPFPLNPYFRPKPPLADTIKSKIYKDYIANPTSNTPRFLGSKYGISIKRVEAILKLKAIEAQLEDSGKVIQKKFTAGMEDILGVPQSSAEMKFNEPLSIPNIHLGAPRFKAISETQSFTSADAAKELNRKQFSKVIEEVNKNAFYEINYPGLDIKYAPRNPKSVIPKDSSKKTHESPKTSEILDSNPLLSNKRWDFVFTDTSKGVEIENRTIVIRTKDGSLINASPAERQKRIKQVWSNKNLPV